jgi:hypothetical protein
MILKLKLIVRLEIELTTYLMASHLYRVHYIWSSFSQFSLFFVLLLLIYHFNLILKQIISVISIL